MGPRPSRNITCGCANGEKSLRLATFHHADGMGPIRMVAFVCQRHAVALANAGWEVARIDEEDAA